jgi:CRISPR-associated protein Csm3
MEKKLGKFSSDGKPCGCGQSDCFVCRVFGPHMNPRHNLGSTRILVRDACFNKTTKEEYEKLAKEKGVSYIEKKTENLVLRTTGTAKDPRSQERVPAGAEFDVEIVIQVYDTDNENDLINFVKEGLRQVQSTYLGGFGSRGSGKVSFYDMKIDGTAFTL